MKARRDLKLPTELAHAATYLQAKKRALARLRRGLDLAWPLPRSRDELYERSRRFGPVTIQNPFLS